MLLRLPVSHADMRGLVPLTTAQSFPPPDRLWSDEDWVLIRRGHKPADMAVSRHLGRVRRCLWCRLGGSALLQEARQEQDDDGDPNPRECEQDPASLVREVGLSRTSRAEVCTALIAARIW